MDPLATEKAWLKANHGELMKEYPGKYLVIKGETLYGGFETYDRAVRAGAKMFGAGPFLVRSVLEPDDRPPMVIPAIVLGIPLVART